MMQALSRLKILALVCCAFALGACANDPVVQAKSVELKAQALYAEYTIAEEAAVSIMKSDLVPDNVKAQIKQAHAVITPMVEAMNDQREVIALLKVSNPADVPTALLALDDLITKLEPLVKGFSRSVNK